MSLARLKIVLFLPNRRLILSCLCDSAKGVQSLLEGTQPLLPSVSLAPPALPDSFSTLPVLSIWFNLQTYSPPFPHFSPSPNLHPRPPPGASSCPLPIESRADTEVDQSDRGSCQPRGMTAGRPTSPREEACHLFSQLPAEPPPPCPFLEPGRRAVVVPQGAEVSLSI